MKYNNYRRLIVKMRFTWINWHRIISSFRGRIIICRVWWRRLNSRWRIWWVRGSRKMWGLKWRGSWRRGWGGWRRWNYKSAIGVLGYKGRLLNWKSLLSNGVVLMGILGMWRIRGKVKISVSSLAEFFSLNWLIH